MLKNIGTTRRENITSQKDSLLKSHEAGNQLNLLKKKKKESKGSGVGNPKTMSKEHQWLVGVTNVTHKP